MAVPSPPVITALALSTAEANVGEPVQVSVSWSGFPTSGVSFQWRRGSTPIKGQVGPAYAPPARWEDLNCLVTIDNGRGTAMSATTFVEFGPAPEGPTSFTAGFSEGFQ